MTSAMGGGEGSQIGQICRWIVIKNVDMGEGSDKNPEKLMTSFLDGPYVFEKGCATTEY